MSRRRRATSGLSGRVVEDWLANADQRWKLVPLVVANRPVSERESGAAATERLYRHEKGPDDANRDAAVRPQAHVAVTVQA